MIWYASKRQSMLTTIAIHLYKLSEHFVELEGVQKRVSGVVGRSWCLFYSQLPVHAKDIRKHTIENSLMLGTVQWSRVTSIKNVSKYI